MAIYVVLICYLVYDAINFEIKLSQGKNLNISRTEGVFSLFLKGFYWIKWNQLLKKSQSLTLRTGAAICKCLAK